MSNKKEYVFIKSANNKPIFLIDRTTVSYDKNGNPIPTEISISWDMCQKGVALKVEKTPFILGRASFEKDIVIVDKDNITLDSDTYFKQRQEELERAEKENVQKQAQKVADSFAAFQEAVDQSVGALGTKVPRGRPKTA